MPINGNGDGVIVGGTDGSIIGNSGTSLNSNVTASALPTGAATDANQATEITSLQLIDDIPHAQNAVFSKGVPLMGQLDDTATTAATENNVAVARITAQRAMHINVRNNSGTEIFTSGTPGVISGTITSSPVDGTKATYSASAVNLVSATSATDIFTITGSATKTVRVSKLYISGLATTGGNITVNFVKRSTANSGGTSSTLTGVPFDSTSAAATAVVRSYTANPTTGTSVGTVRSNRVFISGGATTASSNSFDVFGDFAQAVVLRGTSESLCINLNGVTINSPSLNLWVEWVEE